MGLQKTRAKSVSELDQRQQLAEKIIDKKEVKELNKERKRKLKHIKRNKKDKNKEQKILL